MLSKKVLHYLDRLLRDVCGNTKDFGGKTILLGGDWKQLPPVVEHGTREDQINESIKLDPLFRENFETLRYVSRYNYLHIKKSINSLTINMRTQPDQKQLQEWLIEIGEGTVKETAKRGQNGYFVPIPDEIVIDSLDEITNFCFPPAMFLNPFEYANSIAHNAILCPRNNEVDEINKSAMLRMDGEGEVYLSIDEPLGSSNPLDAYRADSTLEAVHNECPSGFPPHKLFLKVLHITALIL